VPSGIGEEKKASKDQSEAAVACHDKAAKAKASNVTPLNPQ
jgi:hypothetical protein